VFATVDKIFIVLWLAGYILVDVEQEEVCENRRRALAV
jgi:hypothetical protein